MRVSKTNVDTYYCLRDPIFRDRFAVLRSWACSRRRGQLLFDTLIPSRRNRYDDELLARCFAQDAYL